MTARNKIPEFFFDTADLSYIRNAWGKNLSKYFIGKNVVGITTNPNALSKVNCNNLDSMSKLIRESCQLITEIRGDTKGVVYVQVLNSLMTPKEIVKFAEMATHFSDGFTEVGLKIPPFKRALELVDILNDYMDINVTGVSDCATALKCLSYNVRYVSLIPGRMEEAGIDAKRQIQYINQRKETGAEIITGSMRTLDGLEWVIATNTVPTIGTRVFDQILGDKDNMKRFVNMWNETMDSDFPEHFSPPVTKDMHDLSEAFFLQMDYLGRHIYEEFKDNQEQWKPV